MIEQLEYLDQNAARELTSTRSWILTSLFVFLLLSAGAYAPGVKEYFGLRVVPALLTFLPAMIAAFAFGAWHSNQRTFGRRGWLAVLVGTAYVQFFCASLVAWSNAKAAGPVASLVLLAAAYHGHAYRVTLRNPLLAIGTVLAIAGAALLHPTRERVSVLLFVGTAAVGVELIVGTVSARWNEVRQRSERLKAALQAQILNDQQLELNRVSDTLVDLLGCNHDLNNSLMALELHAELLQLAHASHADLQEPVADLFLALRRVKAVAAELTAKGKRLVAPGAEEIDVIPIVQEAVAAMGAMFAGVQYQLELDCPTSSLPVLISGGALTLRRVMENLLLNAYEGDGKRGATSVEVKLSRDESGGCVSIAILDDGPGFPADVDRIEAFVTSKSHGTGLGLYTSERLVRASGGTLTRLNRPEGGADVTILLPITRRSG